MYLCYHQRASKKWRAKFISGCGAVGSAPDWGSIENLVIAMINKCVLVTG